MSKYQAIMKSIVIIERISIIVVVLASIIIAANWLLTSY